MDSFAKTKKKSFQKEKKNGFQKDLHTHTHKIFDEEKTNLPN